MRQLGATTSRLATLLLLHAAGVGFATPAVLVARPAVRTLEWLPQDNQTIYALEPGTVRKLELNTTSIQDALIFITVSPCTKDLRWAIYRGNARCIDGHLTLLTEYRGPEINTHSVIVSRNERYVLQLSSEGGGAATVSVRGEQAKPSRMRLRVRSRKRLSTSWDPSSIDPQATSYCVVASPRRNYTSLCAAQYDVGLNRTEYKMNRFSELDQASSESSGEMDNKIDLNNMFFYDVNPNFKKLSRRKKFSRSTKVTNEDPVLVCVGDRTHHLIENLDPSATYYVSVFGISQDRRAGELLATGKVSPRTVVAKQLRQNVPFKIDLKGRCVFYFKTKVGSGGGLWLDVSTCGGAVDMEVLIRGKRIYVAKNIAPHQVIFVPAPTLNASIQETSDEGSLQFGSSSSEEARMRYVIKVVSSRKEHRNEGVGLQLTASSTRWGIHSPELAPGEGDTVRELRPKRSCRSVHVAFLPATHHATDVIRYCVAAQEVVKGENVDICHFAKKHTEAQCVSQSQRSRTKVIVSKVSGLKPGRKYVIQVTAASKNSAVPYKVLYVGTNGSCEKNNTF